MAARRDALGAPERARLALSLGERVQALPQYAQARSVLATMAIGSEFDLRSLLERALAAGKVLVLPRIVREPRGLELRRVENLARDLVPGVWDIPEPDPARCPEVALAEIDFALVPALAADRAGYRLGYGGGYFDRLLAARARLPYTVTALPAAFVLEHLPHEDCDVPVDRVVDEGPTASAPGRQSR
jgi:5,10-methenyltetrahydrofolate synthetase